MNQRSKSSLDLLSEQRSHILFILSNASPHSEAAYEKWLKASFASELARQQNVLGIKSYRQHEVDVTQGRFQALPYAYLSICDLSIDGAESAIPIEEFVAARHRESRDAGGVATWLYYPASEIVGRRPSNPEHMVTLAFANGIPGREAEFREWYVTRHIRHAMNIPVFASGQCFLRAENQGVGHSHPEFELIALYEQSGPPEEIIKSFESLPEHVLRFPSIDLTRFAEWCYRPF